MVVFQLQNDAGNVLAVNDTVWFLAAPSAPVATASTLFYTVDSSETIVAADAVSPLGERLFVTPLGRSTTAAQLALVSRGNGSAWVRVGPDSSASTFLSAVAAAPGSALIVSTTAQVWYIKDASPCFYIRRSNLAYLSWNGAWAAVPAADTATMFQYLSGALYVQGTLAGSGAAATVGYLDNVAGAPTVTTGALTAPTASAGVIITPAGGVTTGNGLHLGNTLTSAAVFTSGSTQLCTLEMVPSGAVSVASLVAYAWPQTFASQQSWPFPPALKSEPPRNLSTKTIIWVSVGTVVGVIVLVSVLAYFIQRSQLSLAEVRAA